MKLDRLSKEQERILVKTKDDWLSLAFKKNEEGINKSLFEESINWLYGDLLNKKKPEVVYCDSWQSCLLEINLLQKEPKTLNSLRLPVRRSIQSSILNPIREKILASVGEPVLKAAMEMKYDIERKIQHDIWVPISNAITKDASNHKNDFSDYNGWDSYRMLAGYDFFERIGIFKDNNFTKFKMLNESNALTIYEYESVVFAIQPPKVEK